MEAVQRRTRVRPARLLLLAGIGGLAWAAFSVLGSPVSASADDGSNGGSGLLGVVTSTVSSVGDTVGSVVSGVDTTVQHVTAAAAPVVSVVPAPVAAPVAPVVAAVPQTVSTVTHAVDTAATAVVNTATATVGAVAQSAPVSSVVTPVVDLVDTVPVVGDVADHLGVGDLLTGTAGVVDDTLGAVVGAPAPVDGVLPLPPVSALDPVIDVLTPTASSGLPFPGIPGISGVLPGLGASAQTALWGTGPTSVADASARASARAWSDHVRGDGVSAAGSSAASTSAATGYESAWAATPGATGTAGTSASGNGAGGGSAALGHDDFTRTVLGPLGSTVTDDDALPGAPVYDTDVAPD